VSTLFLAIGLGKANSGSLPIAKSLPSDLAHLARLFCLTKNLAGVISNCPVISYPISFMPVVPSSGAISIISLGRSAGSGERLGWAFSFQFVNSERSIVFQEDFNLCCEVQENKDI
jgi:hypothetical protein